MAMYLPEHSLRRNVAGGDIYIYTYIYIHTYIYIRK